MVDPAEQEDDDTQTPDRGEPTGVEPARRGGARPHRVERAVVHPPHTREQR